MPKYTNSAQINRLAWARQVMKQGASPAARSPHLKSDLRDQTWSRRRHKRYLATKVAASAASAALPANEDSNSLSQDGCPQSGLQDKYQYIDIDKDELVSLHFKRSGHIMQMRAKDVAQDFSVFVPASKDLYHLDELSDGSLEHNSFCQSSDASSTSLQLKLKELKLDKTNPGMNIESVQDLSWRQQKSEWRKLFTYYQMLSKMRLTGLVVTTTIAGYGIAPGPFDASTFALCAVGTGLTSCAANSINQFLEVPYDSQMNRTKNRVLVKGFLSPLHAVSFAMVSSCTGLAMLMLGVNATVAALGAFNLGLYTMVYTPMKRLSVINTWVGSIVGAIPPMMGWAACTGGLEPGAWLLGGILFSWQFPHFNALSWNLRPDYSRAGYRMMSVVDPALCQRVAFRHCLLLTGMCFAAPCLGVTAWTFAVDSAPLNFYLTYLGWKFYRKGDSNSSRKLFRFTLIHIPALLLLMGISKAKFGGGDKNQSKSIGEQADANVSPQ